MDKRRSRFLPVNTPDSPVYKAHEGADGVAVVTLTLNNGVGSRLSKEVSPFAPIFGAFDKGDN